MNAKLTLTPIHLVAWTQFLNGHTEVRPSISCIHIQICMKCEHFTVAVAVIPPPWGSPKTLTDAYMTARIKSSTYVENCLLTYRKQLMASLSPA